MKKIDYIKLCREIVLEYVNAGKYAVFLFGSRAYESHPEKADIDIGILGEGRFPESVRYLIKG